MYSGVNKYQLVQTIDMINKNSIGKEREWYIYQFNLEMMRAVTVGNVHKYKELIQQNEELQNDYEKYFLEKYGMTTFHLCCVNGRFSLVEYMVEHEKKDINQKINQGITPFCLLVQNYEMAPKDNIDTLIYFIEQGADVLTKWYIKDAEYTLLHILINTESQHYKYLMPLIDAKLREKALEGLLPFQFKVYFYPLHNTSIVLLNIQLLIQGNFSKKLSIILNIKVFYIIKYH
ncbi:hypothetical protein pb186bvf_010305 [Paramecium bursaria]